MSVLQKEILLSGSMGQRRSVALWVFETALAGQLVQVRFSVALTFHFDDSKENFHDEFFVFDECSEEVIIGAKTLQAWKIVLDFQNDEIRYPKTAMRLRV